MWKHHKSQWQDQGSVHIEIISFLNSFDLDVKTKTKERASHHLLSCKIFHCLGANIDQGREPLGKRVRET